VTVETPKVQEPQPFAHLSAPNVAFYRQVLRAFARAKERFIVHLRPEDVAAELGRGSDEQLDQALEKLVEWGNLRADADTGRVTTVEDFHRKRFLYQMTAAGHAAEQAIEFYEEAIGRRGSLQSVALADIADQLEGLAALAAQTEPDPVKVHLLLLSLAERFSSLADNAQAFMSSLRRAIDFSDGDVDGFIAYKERLIDYINRFIADLATWSPFPMSGSCRWRPGGRRRTRSRKARTPQWSWRGRRRWRWPRGRTGGGGCATGSSRRVRAAPRRHGCCGRRP
jgi:uncharacterized protein (TIGR02677 family)